ncbi:MAG: PQQ-binding-like beta-propeller repeat protein [Bryobacteraceae bacterium]
MRALICFALLSAAFAEDWPQWRGIDRDGKSPEKGLLAKWPSGGPAVAWSVNGMGEGYSAVSISQGRVFTLGQHGDTESVIALDAATGKKLWQTAIGGGYHERRGDGPRSVPTVQGDRLWAYAADGSLASLESKTGKRLWTVNAVKDFGGSVPHWGYSESPLIDGNNVIVNAGGNGTAVVALDKSSGKLVWKSQNDSAAYSSAVLAQVGNVRQVLTFTSRGALALNANNGELLWRYENVANRTANIATPIFHDGHVFYSSDYGTGCALLKLNAEGGSVKANEVYFNRDMKNHYSSSVLVGEHLYGYSSSILTAMKFRTGDVAWRDRSAGKGSVMFADGNLYVVGETGTVALVEATPEAYREKSRFELPKRSSFPAWAPPVIANGILYIRDQDNLHAYKVK